MQKRLPQFTSYHILFLLIGMCFYYTPIKAQFFDLGPKGKATTPFQQGYYTTAASGSGTGQIHCFGIPFGYQYGAWCPNASNVVFAGSTNGGLWKSIDGGQNWNVVDAVQHLPINSVNDIAISNACPNYTIYIATGGTNYHDGPYTCGIYKSVDFGTTFTLISSFNTNSLNKSFNYTDGRIISKIAVSPINPNYIFVATSEGLFRSTDAGATWQFVFSEPRPGSDFRNIWSVVCSPTDVNTVYCSGKEVYKSTALGASGTWSLMSIPISATRSLSFTEACSDGQPHPSTHTFIEKGNINLNVAANSNGTDKLFADMYTTYSYTFDACGVPVTLGTTGINDVYAYNNNTWTLLTQNTSGFRTGIEYDGPTMDRLKIDIMPSDNNKIVAGYVDARVTVNNGTLWKIATPYGMNDASHGDIHAIKFFPSGDSVLIGTDGGVYKYYMNSQTYREQNNGLALSHVLTMSTAPNKKGKLVIGKLDTNADWYDGKDWHQTNKFGDGYPPAIWDKFDNDVFYFASGEELYKGDAATQNLSFLGGSSVFGCLAVTQPESKVYQNPNPTRKDEFYENNGRSIVQSGDLSHMTNFKKLADYSSASNTNFRGMFISKGFPDVVYAWNFVFNPLSDNSYVVKINRANFGATTGCVTSAPCASGCQSELKPLFTADYTNTVVATSFNSTASVPIERYFPISGVTTSDRDALKIWASVDYNITGIKDVLTPYPGHVMYQVRKTVDGGTNWSDYNTGLPTNPVLPITNILYLDGTNDALVCASSNGRVFFRDASMAAWQELDANLPHTKITQLEFNYCQRKLYVGMYGRGVWMYDFSNGTPVLSDLQITGNVIWDNKNYDIAGSIFIQKGATLTIQTNSKINMGKGTKIIIDKGTSATYPNNGGKLIVDNSTLTNACGELWGGIEVRGDANQAQVLYSTPQSGSTLYQAACVIKSSVIEYMKNGINCLNGGQLYAVGSSFLNNRTSINIGSYTNSGFASGYVQDRVEGCTFDITKEVPAGETVTNANRPDFQYHITISGVQGFQSIGNSFKYTSKTEPISPSFKTGILGTEATAEILAKSSSPNTPNTFSNLKYGVLFSNSVAYGNSTYCMKISNNVFTNNQYGAYLNGIVNLKMVQNNFDVPQLFANPQLTADQYTSYGLYLRASWSHKVQDNNFTSMNSFLTGPAYGILVSAGNSLNEVMRRNNFTRLNYAFTAVARNSDIGQASPPVAGLFVQCNTYNQSQNYDFWLAQGTPQSTAGTGSIKYNQGNNNCNYVTGIFAANRFNQTSASLPAFQLIRTVNTEAFSYYTPQDNTQNGDIYYPVRVNQSFPILLSNCVNRNDPFLTYCPETISGTDKNPAAPFIKTQKEISDIKQQLESALVSYKNIGTVSGIEYTELLDSLIAQTYLPYSLLQAALYNPNAREAIPQLKKLLLTHAGNNDSTVYDLLKLKLPFTKLDVLQLKATLSTQTSSAQRAANAIAELETQLENGIRAYSDSLLAAGNSAAALSALQQHPSPNLEAVYAETAFQYDTDAKATTAIQNLLTRYPATHWVHHLGELLQYQQKEKRTANKREQPNIEKLWELYRYGDYASFKAATLLYKTTDTFLAPYIPVPDENASSLVSSFPAWDQISFVNKASLELYPSPANAQVQVLALFPAATTLVLEVIDAKGAVVYQSNTAGESIHEQLNTEKWASGAYLVRLQSPATNEQKAVQLIVQH